MFSSPESLNAITLAGKRFLIVTLGCFRNEYESDLIRSYLSSMNMVEADSLEKADVIIVNTCGFIREACEESIDTIFEIDRVKTELGRNSPVIVLGCMAQRYRHELFEVLEEVQAVMGIHWAGDILSAIEKVLSGRRFCGGFEPGAKTVNLRSIDSTNPYLIVRISDGCDRKCSFCTIPVIRGKHKSLKPEEIIEEIERFTMENEREVILVAQDLTSYGKDLDKGTDLVTLLKMITRIQGVRWIRLMYLQPEGITDELIDEVASNEKICKYFDIPFQHSSERILRLMGRPGSGYEFLRLIGKIREKIPEAAIRTTLMVGFPGENQSDFEILESFVMEARFDWLGVFKYSDEEGTTAFAMKYKIDEATIRERYDKILSLQEYIEQEKASALIGKELELIIEGESDIPGHNFRGRSYREAPEIDGTVYVDVSPGANFWPSAGDFVKSRIVGIEGIDPVAKI